MTKQHTNNIIMSIKMHNLKAKPISVEKQQDFEESEEVEVTVIEVVRKKCSLE